MRDHFYTPFLQLMLPDLFFNKIKCKIQQHGNDAEDHNGHHDEIQFEEARPHSYTIEYRVIRIEMRIGEGNFALPVVFLNRRNDQDYT